jgi:serine/threonine protein kinase
LFKHRIVHRDLKPSNILVSKKGTKIGDFGFAYKIVANQKAEEINAPSAGSPLYMAPEVLEDGKNSSHLSDIWSLGVIFYEMLTGRLPFPAKNKEALIKLIDRIGIRTIIPEHLSLRSK